MPYEMTILERGGRSGIDYDQKNIAEGWYFSVTRNAKFTRTEEVTITYVPRFLVRLEEDSEYSHSDLWFVISNIMKKIIFDYLPDMEWLKDAKAEELLFNDLNRITQDMEKEMKKNTGKKMRELLEEMLLGVGVEIVETEDPPIANCFDSDLIKKRFHDVMYAGTGAEAQFNKIFKFAPEEELKPA